MLHYCSDFQSKKHLHTATEMALPKIMPSIHGWLAMVAGRTRMLDYRIGDHSVGEFLSAWYRNFQRSTVTVANPILVDGHHFYHSGGPISLDMASGLYELKTVGLVRRLLRQGMTFVDVGAHVGWHTVAGARAVGENVHVYAFEPVPLNFDLLRKNVVINGYECHVTLTRRAICDVPRRVSIITSEEDSAASSMFASPRASAEVIEVEASSLDQFFGERGWPSVDLIKMDIEGAEGAALQGMVELSRRNPDLKLIIEYMPPLIEAAGNTPRRLFQSLKELGFFRRSIISWQLIPVESPADIARHAPAKNWTGNLLCEKVNN